MTDPVAHLRVQRVGWRHFHADSQHNSERGGKYVETDGKFAEGDGTLLCPVAPDRRNGTAGSGLQFASEEAPWTPVDWLDGCGLYLHVGLRWWGQFDSAAAQWRHAGGNLYHHGFRRSNGCDHSDRYADSDRKLTHLADARLKAGISDS